MEESTKSANMDNYDTDSKSNFLTGTTGIDFESTHDQPAKIKVIGVGGGGGNAVNHMFREGIHGVEFIVCNTDAKALETSPVPNKIVLGKLGAGNIPDHARKMAEEHEDEIRQAISDDTQMLFITAGMGGGTGTGAAPVIAKIAKSIELKDDLVPRILVVAIVTEPFSFEGPIRAEQAKAGIEALKDNVDAILVINNDNLRRLGNMDIDQAFSKADDVLLTAAKGIAEIITMPGKVNIDFRDVNTVMQNSGTALMGAGEGRGEGRALQAIEGAATSVLLNNNDIRGSQKILLYFSYSPNHKITMDELDEVTGYLKERTGKDSNVIWGNGEDDSLDDELRITLIATGFKPLQGVTIHPLEPEKTDPVQSDNKPITITAPEPKDIVEPAVDDSGVRLIHRVAPVATTTVNAPEQIVQTVETAEPVAKPIESASYDNPFDSIATPDSDGKRRLTLELNTVTPVETHEEEVVSAVEDTVAASNESIFDEIRVIHRPAEPAKEPAFKIEQTEAFDVKRTEPVAPTATEQQTFADIQMKQAMTPDDGAIDRKVLERAEKIKRIMHINDLLHNKTEGPAYVESLTTEQLSGRAPYFTTPSTESDASRSHINPNGTLSPGMNFLEDLPD